MEHTQPKEGVHRLALMSSVDDFMLRLKTLIPLQPVNPEGRPQYTIALQDFQKMQQYVESAQEADLLSLLNKCGLKSEMAEMVVQAMLRPLFTLSLAFFVCNGDTAADASSAAIFANESAAWGIWGGLTGLQEGEYLLLPTGINDIQAACKQWLGVS